MSKSSSGFIHSVKVPRLYKTASNIAKKVVEEGGSLKDLIYNSSHKNTKGLYALVVEAIKHSKDLDEIIRNSKLFQNETRLQPWLARILITELIFGKKELKGNSKPVKTILSYKKQFEKFIKHNEIGHRNLRTTDSGAYENTILKMANVVLVFLMYSTAILVLPLLTFFAVKNILEKEFHITGFTNTAWSVIGAVLMVNLIIMAYAWRAFKQEIKEERNESMHISSLNEEISPLIDIDLKKDK